jgi:hypothetical protein
LFLEVAIKGYIQRDAVVELIAASKQLLGQPAEDRRQIGDIWTTLASASCSLYIILLSIAGRG